MKKKDMVDNKTTQPAADNKKEENKTTEQEIKLENGASAEQQKPNIVEELQRKVENQEKEKLELIEKIKLGQAELINYRKRKDEETSSILKYANQDLIQEIIPLIDNFENAIKMASKSENSEVAKYLTGFQMMYTNLLAVLSKFGVEPIERTGQIFDSSLEQALVAENNPDLEDEVVIEVLQKGYKLKDRVIRPASVKINQK